MESFVSEEKLLSTSRDIVRNVLDGAKHIIMSETDFQQVDDLETSSSSSDKGQDHPVPDVIDKARDLTNTQSTVEEADKVEAEHSSSDTNLANDIVHEAIDNAREKWQKMQLETECAAINAKSKTITKPCLRNEAVQQPMEAEKTETAKTLPADTLHASFTDNDAVGSSKSLNVDGLYRIKKEVPLTGGSLPNLKCFASSLAIAVSPAISSPQEFFDQENALKNESRQMNMISWSRQRSPLKSLAGKDSNNKKDQDDSSATSSLVSAGSRTVSVGLLGVRVGSSSEPNLSNGIFDLQKAPSDHVSATLAAVSSSPVHPSGCQEDRGLKMRKQDCKGSSSDKSCAAQRSIEDVSTGAACELSLTSLAGNETTCETGVVTKLAILEAAKDFIMHSGVQTEQGQDIFVVDPSKIPGKRDFEQKEEFKEIISCLCLYARSYIQDNIKSDKFLLVVHTPNDNRSRMKSRESIKKFYRLLKDSFSYRLVKCVIYKPEFKLKAFVNICRPFLQSSMRKKFCTVRNQQSMVEVYGVPENAVEV